MNRPRLLLSVAAVLAGAATLFVVLGAVFNPLLVAAAVPFGLAAYFLWLHATGRLEDRMRTRVISPGTAARRRRRRGDVGTANARGGPWSTSAGPRRDPTAGRSRGDERPPEMDRQEALRTLGLASDADQATIRRAYRERVKTVHPDASNGDEAAFRRLTVAYDRLRER